MADDNNAGQFGNREDTEEQARKGGQSQGKSTNPGNFANDREKASRAGREGGKNSRGTRDENESDMGNEA